MNMRSIIAITALVGATLANAPSTASAQPTQAPAAEAEQALSSAFANPYGYSPFMRDAREFYGQSPLDWPAAEARELGFARARTIIAQWEMIHAGDRIDEQVARYKRQFENSKDYQDAKASEDEAWQLLQQASASVAARLADNPQYQANLALASDLRTRIDDRAFENPGVISGRVLDDGQVDLALARLSYASRASAIRAEAMAEDPGVAEARARLRVAAARQTELQREFTGKLLDDPVLRQLRLVQETNKAMYSAAYAYEQSARTVRKAAGRYARYLHRSDSFPYYGSAYAGGYGGFVRPYDIDYGVRRAGGVYGFKRRD